MNDWLKGVHEDAYPGIVFKLDARVSVPRGVPTRVVEGGSTCTSSFGRLLAARLLVVVFPSLERT